MGGKKWEEERQRRVGYLLPHVGVHVHVAPQIRTIHVEVEPGFFESRAEDAREVDGDVGEVHGHETRLHSAGLNPREVENGVHQAAKTLRVPLYRKGMSV